MSFHARLLALFGLAWGLLLSWPTRAADFVHCERRDAAGQLIDFTAKPHWRSLGVLQVVAATAAANTTLASYCTVTHLSNGYLIGAAHCLDEAQGQDEKMTIAFADASEQRYYFSLRRSQLVRYAEADIFVMPLNREVRALWPSLPVRVKATSSLTDLGMVALQYIADGAECRWVYSQHHLKGRQRAAVVQFADRFSTVTHRLAANHLSEAKFYLFDAEQNDDVEASDWQGRSGSLLLADTTDGAAELAGVFIATHFGRLLAEHYRKLHHDPKTSQGLLKQLNDWHRGELSLYFVHPYQGAIAIDYHEESESILYMVAGRVAPAMFRELTPKTSRFR